MVRICGPNCLDDACPGIDGTITWWGHCVTGPDLLLGLLQQRFDVLLGLLCGRTSQSRVADLCRMANAAGEQDWSEEQDWPTEQNWPTEYDTPASPAKPAFLA